ncbi:Ig-like domain-containing protein [Geobacter sp.]|uniref:Ig-like domain-containing protein n=1 Tax=Geobacter sp. TaxID=46610 RepID=UPI00261FF1A6|nr:Ig-like domain-containing protein [Geobacter sp.]
MVCRSPKRMVSVAFSLAFLVISLATTSLAALAPVVVAQNPISEGMRSPLRVAVDSTGNSYVTDPLSGGVLKYNPFGHLTALIKTAHSPQGIAIAADGSLLVGQGDYVAILGADGTETGRLGTGAGQFKMVNGITVDSAGFIYVVDSQDNCVQVFNANGVYARRFGSFGTANGQFSTPSGIAFEKISGQVAVVDTRNGRVQFFDTNGVYKRTVGVFGSGALGFTAPQGVAFEYTSDPTPALKRMYVVDTFQSTVQAIDPNGTQQYLSTFGGYGGGKGQLMVPSDLVFDQAYGRLLVVNGYGNLSVFNIDGGGVPVDTTPPALTIDPVPATVYAATVDVSGIVEAGAAMTISASGGAVVSPISFPSAGTWRVTLSGLVPGSTTVTVTARDASLNAATLAATVNYLQPAPQLALDPTSSVTNDPYQLLSGTVDAGSTVTVANTTTGANVTATVFGTSWSCRVPLANGLNALTVKATRPQSAAGTLSLATILDTAAPVLHVSALADGSYTSEQVQNIQATVSDANIGTVLLNGEPVTLANGAFSTAVTLNNGPNVITVVAADLAGNSVSDTRTIIFDPTRPVVTFAAPAEGGYVAVNHVTVSGSVDKTAKVTVAGQPATMTGKEWSADVPLVAGLNTVEVTAVDLAGNVTTVKRTVVFDADAPTLVLTSPTQDKAVNTKSVALTGLVSDSAPVTFTADVNGVPVQVEQADGTFALGVTFADEGTYAITIRATDAAGNTGTVTRTLIYDTTPPALALNAVNTPFPAELSGTVEQGATVTVEDKNGAAGTVTMSGEAWQATLTVGSYDADTLAVRATDAAGNSTVKALVVQVPDGDLDGDGKVAVQDALLALKVYLGQIKPTAAYLTHGDIGPLLQGKAHPNGAVDMVDIILILRKALGMQSW